MLTVAVLGPVEVRRDGDLVTVPTGKTTEVLVRLALEAGRPVRVEQILDDVWADAAPAGRNTLQSKVSQLRRALGDSGVVTAAGDAYTLQVAPAGVDALRVHGLAESVAVARRNGDHTTVADLASQALDLFRGEMLPACEGAWLIPHQARLEEVRLGLVEELMAARVALGAGGEMIGQLESLVEQYPLREALWSSLITALYRVGRQADALGAYRRVRLLLCQELGLDPGPALRSLEEQILVQSPFLMGEARERVVAGGVGNLPALLADLVGRGSELADLHQLVGTHRLVTVVGPAGVGKTRAAIEVGRGLDRAAGVWLVRLDGADASTSLPQLAAETLQVTGGEAALVDRLAGTDAVLVLDNCEHVVDDAAALVTSLLDAAIGLSVLATSQVPLGLPGEVVRAMGPLPPSDAAALFRTRAVSTRRDVVIDDEAMAVVEELCSALDGLPLAIELAAARVRALSIQEIARRLDDRFALLQDPTSRAPERRRALRAAIGWSYDLLFPDDQRGLWALSVFSGGAPLAAVEHVLAALDVPAVTAIDVTERLVGRSLADVEVGPGGTVRYRLLDSVRVFARDRLEDAGLAEVAARSHVDWFAQTADWCAAVVRGPAQPACVAVARAERGNIDLALAWAGEHDPLLAVRLVNGFAWTWVVLGDGAAAATRIRNAVRVAAGSVPADAEAAALLAAGWLEASAGDVQLAQADLDQAAARAAGLADERLVADLHRHTAFLRIQQGRPHDVLTEAAASLEFYRKHEDSWDIAASLLLSAYGSIMLGDTSGARTAADQAVALLEPLQDSWGLVHARGMLGAIAQAEHRFDDAAHELAAAAEECERLGFLGQAALHLTRLGRVEQQRGDHDAATLTLAQALNAAERNGDMRIAATARTTMARLMRATGDDLAAATLLDQSDHWYRRAGGDGALLVRALLAAVSDRADLADVLAEARRVGDREAELVALDALARVAAESDDTVTAFTLLKAADDIHAELSHLVDEADRTDANWVRQKLSEFECAFEQHPDDDPHPARAAGPAGRPHR